MQGASKKALLESPLHVALKPPTTWLAWQSDEPTTSSAGQDKTKIAARLIPAVIAAKPVNRSSDLVPLNRDYDLMRRELKAIIASAKKYHDAVIQLDQARLDVRFPLPLLSELFSFFCQKSSHPIFYVFTTHRLLRDSLFWLRNLLFSNPLVILPEGTR